MNEGKKVTYLFGFFRSRIELVFFFCRQVLEDLNERFNSLEDGSKNMVAQVMEDYSHFVQSIKFLTLLRRNAWQLSNQRKDGLGSEFNSYFLLFLFVLYRE